MPDTAVVQARADVPLSTVVTEWSVKWFVGGAAVIKPVDHAMMSAGNHEATWEHDAGIQIDLSTSTLLRISEMMFGTPDDWKDLTDMDRQMLVQAAEMCAADLRQRLSAMFRRPPDPWRVVAKTQGVVAGSVWRLVREDGEVLAILSIADHLLIDWKKASLSPSQNNGSLSPLPSALAMQSLTLSASVGRCQLTTSELTDLEVGDVVILDAMLGSTATLVIDGGIGTVRCRIDPHGEHLQLSLV